MNTKKKKENFYLRIEKYFGGKEERKEEGQNDLALLKR